MVSQEIEDWSTARLLVTASRMLEHAWEQLLRDHGVTHAGYTILEECLLDGAQPQRKLARSCRVTDQTISRTIERLARKDLVSRETDPSDERRQLVSITEAGREVYKRVLADVRASTMLSDAVSDSAQLRVLLLEMITKFERAAEQAAAGADRVAVPEPGGVAEHRPAV